MAIFNEKGQRVIQSSNRSASSFSNDSGMDGLNSPAFGGVDNSGNAKQKAQSDLQSWANSDGMDSLNFFGRDPYAFRQISFPTDITTNPARGHYMLFYVNVQNKSKYKHTDYYGLEVGNTVTTFIKGDRDKDFGTNTDYTD
ncbi:MAG: hypothetical protein QF535_22380, partial [Anaerolineales bacterium]|nr:hypothetical protein [Anaerolineales bacterium]